MVQAVVQAAGGANEHTDKMLQEYKKAQMPYLEKVENTDRRAHIKKLMEEVSRGPISITPVMQKRVRSKLKTRVVQRSDEERMASMQRVSSKMAGLV